MLPVLVEAVNNSYFHRRAEINVSILSSLLELIQGFYDILPAINNPYLLSDYNEPFRYPGSPAVRCTFVASCSGLSVNMARPVDPAGISGAGCLERLAGHCNTDRADSVHCHPGEDMEPVVPGKCGLPASSQRVAGFPGGVYRVKDKGCEQ